jgi:hypothetical protein
MFYGCSVSLVKADMRLVFLSLILAATSFAAAPPVAPGHSLWAATWTIADFDGDGQPDLLTTHPEGYAELQLSSRTGASFSFLANGGDLGISIAARDVDGDHDLDLVITARGSHRPIGVWINDGRGVFKEGNAEAYSASIWQVNGAGFMAPAPPLPSCASTLQERRTALDLPLGVLQAGWRPSGSTPNLAAVVRVRAPFSLASPRAPPLSVFFSSNV